MIGSNFSLVRNARIPLLRIRAHDLNNADPLVGPRLAAAIHIIVERTSLLRSEAVQKLNTQISRLEAKAFVQFAEAKMLPGSQPPRFSLGNYLIAAEFSELLELHSERDVIVSLNEGCDLQQLEEESVRFDGIKVTLASVESSVAAQED
jgi:hypothetical protein